MLNSEGSCAIVLGVTASKVVQETRKGTSHLHRIAALKVLPSFRLTAQSLIDSEHSPLAESTGLRCAVEIACRVADHTGPRVAPIRATSEAVQHGLGTSRIQFEDRSSAVSTATGLTLSARKWE